ncbi:MAG: 30S ribosomal protein S17 [Candidatus Cardinium sp.]|uniref:Small ribosomal subunit protein uS17 n=1 Tax=Candidatus Cardinium hertigii TaxID=247481 RepID=A0A2Z3LGW2_9BACT|nr:30S ribosomal protein S17 [Candidatus Cardinium hertigii]AWN81755.1 30S ribosomal protein S17 [Candidatus Cardinium hertigii]MDD9139599.1 30S ribosomal protein S17 [Candidatus Cardinium sp.]
MLRNKRKEKIGRVTSNKSDKTITVVMNARMIHPVYGKFVKTTTKFMAHDAANACHVGDLVKIMETRPVSKRKRWRLVEIMERAK